MRLNIKLKYIVVIYMASEIVEIGGMGNTKPSPSNNQLKKWFFTFNNFDEINIEILKLYFNSICEKWIFQEEIGENGTKHLQGAIWLKKRMRWSEFDFRNEKCNKKIHWEKTKGTDQQVIDYCSKTESWTGRRWFYKIIIPEPLRYLKECDLYNWQKKIEDLIKERPDDRSIYWIWDPMGKNGKSQLVKRLVIEYDCLLITGGKKSDVLNMVYNYVIVKYLNVVLLNCPRCIDKVSYSSLEDIKDGIIINTKYETGSKIINSPHVIVFSNHMPELDKMTKDRWKLFKIVNKELEILDLEKC